MGHGHHGAGVAGEKLLQPFHRLGVEMVGGFVQQQHVRFLQQQAAQRDATLLAAGQRPDLRVPRRDAQRVGGDFQLLFEHVRVVGGENRLQPLLFGGELVEVGSFFGIGLINPIQCGLGLQHFADAFLHRLAHGLVRVEFGLLRQVADLDTGLRACFALKILVHAGHDLEDGGLA